MKKYFNANWINEKLPKPVLFVMALAILIYIFPRQSNSEYNYTINTPWMYELLRAPYNFDVKKSDKQLQAEQDSIKNSSSIYLLLNSDIAEKIVGQITEMAEELKLPKNNIDYLTNKVKTIYKTGVISAEELDRLTNDKRFSIQLIKGDNVAYPRNIKTFYTPKQVYQFLVDDAPLWIDRDKVKQMNFSSLLVPNIVFDDKVTKQALDDALRNISLFEGQVVAGQKIIDKGEIINSHTYDILNSYFKNEGMSQSDKHANLWHKVGLVIILGLFMTMLNIYLKIYRPLVYEDTSKVTFILLLIVVFAIVASVIAEINTFALFFVIPFTIPVILVRIFIDSRTAVITSVVLIFISMIMLPPNYMLQFLITQTLVTYVCIFSLRRLEERSQLVYTSLFIFLTYVLSYTGWLLFEHGHFDLSTLYSKKDIYIYFCVNFVLVSFAYSLIFVIERVFGFISEVTMIELSNTSRDLLLELSEVAPGTFQHSMQVSNLVVAAATKIGANAILARTGALYHDIGKMINTIFFTENQPEGVNPHKYLSATESARIIIGHIDEGVKIAKKHKLPKQIIEFIQTHHGKGMASYFYTAYCNEHMDEEVDKKPFTYPGPNPCSKETALLMMADTIEATSRSLKENTKEAITEMVNRLIDKQISEGMFNDAPITFKDIRDIKEVFIERLISMRHVRVAYPELKEKPDTSSKSIVEKSDDDTGVLSDEIKEKTSHSDDIKNGQ